ncbi:hypothetical protein [Flavobacterium ardleyense]|uniref:hypothetical protein n=1 Tax=Flavobacterium ardleyense TaxID=2038737 RepID=UPI00298CEA5B|nr:hypothetical protein [Flavobacterium ardleyense]
MSNQNKKQFGVWMDSHKAIIVGRKDLTEGDFVVLGTVKNAGGAPNSNENTANNHEITMTQKFFKEICSHMENVDQIHLTGTGQIQEEFTKYLAATPQYKNVEATDSTSQKIDDEKLIEMISAHFE